MGGRWSFSVHFYQLNLPWHRMATIHVFGQVFMNVASCVLLQTPAPKSVPINWPKK